MERKNVVIAACCVLLALAVPWLMGQWIEHLVRARLVQVQLDPSARFRVKIDRYDRGYAGATAQFTVVDRNGVPLLTTAAKIRQWPFAGGSFAEWDAVPEFGEAVRDALAPWGSKLPVLTTHTRLSWRGDMRTEIATEPFVRRVPEVASGVLDIAAISGVIDWRHDGPLTYDIRLPALRIERLSIGRAEVPSVTEWKDIVLSGDGSLGTSERQWNQNGSITAASVTVKEGGTTAWSATAPVISYASRNDGENIAVLFKAAATTLTAANSLQSLSDAAVEFTVDVKHVARAPLDKLLDATGRATDRESVSESLSAELFANVLRGSPAADVRIALKSREGAFEIKLALAFDGEGLDPKSGTERWPDRLDAELDVRAGMKLVIAGMRAGTRMASEMMRARAGVAPEVPGGPPPPDPDAVGRQRLVDAAAQGWIRIDGDEVVAVALWRKGQLTVNGQNMNALRDLAKGMAGR